MSEFELWISNVGYNQLCNNHYQPVFSNFENFQLIQNFYESTKTTVVYD